jgi:hypothetical protein
MSKPNKPPFDVPNLDCASPSDLQAFIATHRGKKARNVQRLVRYARARFEAHMHRLGGRIELALAEERHMASLYSQLPTEWRW